MFLLRQGFDSRGIDYKPAQRAVEECESLERLAQIMAGGGKKAALALVRPISTLPRLIGKLPRGLGCLVRNNQLRLDALAVRDIANCCGGEDPVSVRDGAQADLDRELGTVAALCEEFQARSHRTNAYVTDVVLSVSEVPQSEPFWHQQLDSLANDLVVPIAE
jgi:hypothetical protein